MGLQPPEVSVTQAGQTLKQKGVTDTGQVRRQGNGLKFLKVGFGQKCTFGVAAFLFDFGVFRMQFDVEPFPGST